MRRATVLLSTMLLTMALAAVPAQATIHEIVASWCAFSHEVASPTGDIHDPPGLSPEALGGTSEADNIAQPLLSSGAFNVVEADGDELLVAPIFPTIEEGDTLLVINEDAPNVKLVGTGLFFYDAAADVYVELGEPDPDFPAFANCANGAG